MLLPWASTWRQQQHEKCCHQSVSELSVEISGIPEALILSLCELIKTISSLQLQDIQLYLQGGDQAAIWPVDNNLWNEYDRKHPPLDCPMPMEASTLPQEVGVPLGVQTEGSIEKLNQDVKQANSSFVARKKEGKARVLRVFACKISVESIHKIILLRWSWEADPVLRETCVRWCLEWNVYI